MYLESSCASLTAQGRAIKDAAVRFGDGATLPFTPCKKGFIPVSTSGERMYACPIHNVKRKKRFVTEKEQFRKGERELYDLWDKKAEEP